MPEPDKRGVSPFATPLEALAHQAETRGDAEALAFPNSGGRLTFRAWHEQSLKLAEGLRGRGLGPGDHIALLAENRLEWPVVQLAVAALGAVLVPLNSPLPAGRPALCPDPIGKQGDPSEQSLPAQCLS